MKHNQYLDTKCRKCGTSLNFYEDSLSLYECFHCRGFKYALPSNLELSCHTIKALVKYADTPHETRTKTILNNKIIYFDLYRLQINDELYFFGVQRGNYERITWLSLDEVCNFVGNSVIDKILEKERK